MRRLSLPVLFVTVVSAASFIGLSASPAHADPLCYEAQTVGTKIPHITAGPVCVQQYPFGVECSTELIALEPTAGVLLDFCTP